MVIYYGMKHKESPKPSDKSFPRCNNFAASEMRLRRAKALPTCKNYRKKNRPPVGWWLKNPVVLYSEVILFGNTQQKSQGKEKNYLKNICLKTTISRQVLQKKQENDFNIMSFLKPSFQSPIFLIVVVCFFLKKRSMDPSSIGSGHQNPEIHRNPLFSVYIIPYESEIRI